MCSDTSKVHLGFQKDMDERKKSEEGQIKKIKSVKKSHYPRHHQVYDQSEMKPYIGWA